MGSSGDIPLLGIYKIDAAQVAAGWTNYLGNFFLVVDIQQVNVFHKWTPEAGKGRDDKGQVSEMAMLRQLAR